MPATRKAGKPQRIVLNHDHQLRAVRFSPDGNVLVSADDGGFIKVWNPKTGANLHTIQATTLGIYGLAFSTDGQTLATSAGNWRARAEGEVQFWNTQTWKTQGETIKLPREAWAVAFAPNQQTVAVAGGDAQIRLIDVKSQKVTRTIATPSGLRTLAYSPDGALLAAAHGNDQMPVARVWDTAAWVERPALTGHSALIFSVRFAPDSQTIVTASKDATVKVWDIPTTPSAVASK